MKDLDLKLNTNSFNFLGEAKLSELSYSNFFIFESLFLRSGDKSS
jgi:hypothetical protein